MHHQLKDPSYPLHKQSGQGIVTLSDGIGGRRDVLSGRFDSDISRAEYYRVVQEWRTNGRRFSIRAAGPEQPGPSINELLLSYFQHAEGYYVKVGEPTSEVAGPSLPRSRMFLSAFWRASSCCRPLVQTT